MFFSRYQSIRLYLFVIASLIITALPGFSAFADEDTESVPVIACLGISEFEFEDWHGVLGDSIWLGYPEPGETPEWGTKHGFAVPEDAVMIRRYTWDTSVGERYVWVFYSSSTPDLYYVFPFKTMEEFADSNGNHMGVHPCGAFSTSRAQLDDIIG